MAATRSNEVPGVNAKSWHVYALYLDFDVDPIIIPLTAEVAKVGVNIKYGSHFIVWSYPGLNSLKFSGAVPPSVFTSTFCSTRDW